MPIIPDDLKAFIQEAVSRYPETALETQGFYNEFLAGRHIGFWATVLFTSDIPLMAHFMNSRKDPERIKGLAYNSTFYHHFPDCLPRLSGVVFKDPSAAIPIPENEDPFWNLLYETVKDLDADHCWVISIPAPDAPWIREQSDDAFLVRHPEWKGYFYNLDFSWDSGWATYAIGVLRRRKHNLFQVEPEWSMWNDEGMIWWPGHFMQEVNAIRSIHGTTGLRISTDLVSCVDPDITSLNSVLLELHGRLSGLSAPVYDPASRMIRLFTTIWFNESNIIDCFNTLIFSMTLQAADAERLADPVASQCHGQPARSDHPVNGMRPEPSSIFRARESLIKGSKVPMCDWEQPSAMYHLVNVLMSMGIKPNYESDGYSILLPYREGTQAYLDAYSIDHEDLGACSFFRLLFPHSGSLSEMAQIAAGLNRQEWEGDPGLLCLGSWGVLTDSGQPQRAHLAFWLLVPHACQTRYGFLDVVLSLIKRTQWTRERSTELGPEMPCPENRYPLQASSLPLSQIPQSEQGEKQ